jgi:hypothetical protein
LFTGKRSCVPGALLSVAHADPYTGSADARRQNTDAYPHPNLHHFDPDAHADPDLYDDPSGPHGDPDADPDIDGSSNGDADGHCDTGPRGPDRDVDSPYLSYFFRQVATNFWMGAL